MAHSSKARVPCGGLTSELSNWGGVLTRIVIKMLQTINFQVLFLVKIIVKALDYVEKLLIV